MNKLTELTNQMPELLAVFILMLSTFLIGYFSAWWFQKLYYNGLIRRLKKEVNDSIRQRKINNIDTLYTELKPRIEETVKNNIIETMNLHVDKKVSAEKARSNYVTYNISKPELDHDRLGYGNNSSKDDLTQISGVGPYIELKLNEIGIYNYDQLRRLNESDIMIITKLIDFFPGRIERDNWVSQAQELQEG